MAAAGGVTIFGDAANGAVQALRLPGNPSDIPSGDDETARGNTPRTVADAPAYGVAPSPSPRIRHYIGIRSLPSYAAHGKLTCTGRRIILYP